MMPSALSPNTTYMNFKNAVRIMQKINYEKLIICIFWKIRRRNGVADSLSVEQ